jgi:nitrite reductase/ring-hydroxylating ferredoxin subunit
MSLEVDMWHQVAKVSDIAPGGMKAVRVEDREICLCEYDGAIHAVSRRCGHQNAPMEQGALQGWVLTCPLHDAQFDIRDGTNLSWPIDRYMGEEPLPEPVARFQQLERRLQWKTRVHDLRTYKVRVTDDSIEVFVPAPCATTE